VNAYGVLVPKTIRRKPRLLMESLVFDLKRKRLDFVKCANYAPCETLFLYGWGGSVQQEAIAQHQGHYVAFDLGYWQREGQIKRKWRVSIDGFHCPQLIMKGRHPGGQRWERQRWPIPRSGGNPDGPVLIVGSGPKSQRVGAMDWSKKASLKVSQRFPDKEVWYKPKPMRTSERGVRFHKEVTGEIEPILKQVSLVVCRHSNVAVDAARAGVPATCEDGAAASIYPTLENFEDQPDYETRVEFLQRLAWWQWTMQEVRNGDFWPWIDGQLRSL